MFLRTPQKIKEVNHIDRMKPKEKATIKNNNDVQKLTDGEGVRKSMSVYVCEKENKEENKRE